MILERGRLIWGMDSPSIDSFIVQAPIEQPQAVERIHELPGPAYYMSRNQAGALYVGTTVERGKTMTYRLGHLLGTLPDGRWEDILRLEKDWFPQYGILYFPRGTLPENYLVYSQRALRPYEGFMTIARDTAWG
jgi:hypothetical protein